MIHSMTGFGKAAVKSRFGAVTVEIKSLNHKFFELSAKIPNGLAEFEDILKNKINEKIKRGKIYLNIELNGQKDVFSNVIINRKAARHYTKELTGLKRSLSLKGDVTLEHIINLPGVIVAESVKTGSQRLLPYIKEALGHALKELLKDRAKEGKALCKDLSNRIQNIARIVGHIDERSNVSIIKYKDHLEKRIKELTGAAEIADKGRLEQEVALFAKNSDISEEITRLKSHISSFKESLLSDKEAGKKLDFIAQELHREANTIASKSPDFKTSKGVIQIKSDIEKIREQVKNIE